jgi:uncharacterized Tic20 family protein
MNTDVERILSCGVKSNEGIQPTNLRKTSHAKKLNATSDSSFGKRNANVKYVYLLNALAGFVFPFGNILGPLFILNFQITISIAFIISCLIAARVGYLFYPIVILIYLCGYIFPIAAVIKANNGTNFRYPLGLKSFR